MYSGKIAVPPGGGGLSFNKFLNPPPPGGTAILPE
jgi:hypothetical protein